MATPTKAHARVAHSIITACHFGIDAIIHDVADVASAMQRRVDAMMEENPHIMQGPFAALVRDAYYYLGYAIDAHASNASTIIGYDPLVTESWTVVSRKHAARLEGMDSALTAMYGL